MTGTVTKPSPRSVADTVSLLCGMLADHGMKVFDVIDQAAEARQVGLELRDTVLVLFGSPVAGTPVMVTAPLAALDLPLRLLIWDDDGTTNITYTAPDALAARYGIPPELARHLAGIDALAEALSRA